MTRSIRAAAEAWPLVIAFAAALLMAPVYGRTVHSFAPIAAALLIAALSLLYGRSLGRLLRVPLVASYGNAFELVVGFSGVSLVHLTATAVLNLTALAALAVDLVCGAALFAVTVVRQRSGVTRPAARRPAVIAIDVCVIVACGALVAFWTRETTFSIPEAETTGFFRAWQDFFLHASEITYLRDYPAFGPHAQYLAGAPQPLYHRASYAMSGVFSFVAGVPSLETATTTFWMPTGLLLCVLATYAYGCALGGRLAGLAAVTAVFLFPDPSTYVLKNRYLSFLWLMQVTPGSGYALALTFLALIVVATADRLPDRWGLTAAAALVGAAAAFRVHIAALAGGMLLLLVCFTWRPALTRRRIAMVFAALLAAAAAIVLMESVTLAPHFLTGQPHPLLFLQGVNQLAEIPTTYATWTKGRSNALTFVIGYTMLLVSACGLTIPALVVVGLGNMLGQSGHRYAVLSCAGSDSHRHHSDFSDNHLRWRERVRPSSLGANLRRRRRVSGCGRRAAVGRVVEPNLRRRMAGHGSAGRNDDCGFAGAFENGPDLQQRWGPDHALIPIRVEDFEAGRFVRRHSTPGEYVLTADTDPLAFFVGVTERTAWLSRRKLYQRIGGATGALAAERAAAHDALAPLTFEQLQSFGRSRGLRWYVANTPASQQWPAAVTSRCAYCGRGIQVYDLR